MSGKTYMLDHAVASTSESSPCVMLPSHVVTLKGMQQSYCVECCAGGVHYLSGQLVCLQRSHFSCGSASNVQVSALLTSLLLIIGLHNASHLTNVMKLLQHL